MGTRRKSRELVLQMLFQADMGKQTADQVRSTFWAEHGAASAEVRGFADDLFRVALDRIPEIDSLIERHAEHWRMERMAAVDRNLLRAGVAEFLAYPETVSYTHLDVYKRQISSDSLITTARGVSG